MIKSLLFGLEWKVVLRSSWVFVLTTLFAHPVPTTNAQDIPSLGKVGPVELVQQGFQFLEGPAKTPDGALYFTDIPAEAIYKLTVDGKIEEFLKPSGFANGLMYGGDGQLLACQMAGQLVKIDLSTKQITVLASEHGGARLNAPNDLVIDRQGGIYFSDPRYRAPQPWPQQVEAFYYRAPDGTVTRLGADLKAPNGVALSPDESTLYVIPSMQSEMMAYPVEAPGKLGTGRVFCQLQQLEGKSASGGDGLAVDSKGNLFITSEAGVQVFSAAGELLGIIQVPEQPANCAFGGADNKTLYITARTGLYRCSLPIAGHLYRGQW
ncbi:MAG: SMP-30/gluconolactonase/LRE family protein [Pirellulaceae bacterium]|nr:SMP-30/gluconolactonase/LRE family protein [Pirellulaceae bacterium]